MTHLPIERADEFIALLTERLPEKTLRHSVSVAETMLAMAEETGITAVQAVTAGLLHDLCKAMKSSKLLKRALKYGIEPTVLQAVRPMLLHGALAAEECRRSLGIDDESVYDAIYWHTTGRPEWCTLGLVLYVADFSEPLRPLEEAKRTRDILHAEGFHAALRFVVACKESYVQEHFTPEPTSKAFAEWTARKFSE